MAPPPPRRGAGPGGAGLAGGGSAYDVLGVAPTATEEEIKQAYHALALQHHPDKARDQSPRRATERFQAIQAAYESVSSPASRRLYDAGLSAADGAANRTKLMEACSRGDHARAADLLEHGAEPDERDATGRTALMYACSAACLEAIRTLLKYGADLEARNCAGHSCLMFAVGAGIRVDCPERLEQAQRHLEATRLLLDEGAPVNAATGYGLSALMLACASGRMDMIELLLSRGADATAASDIGLTALAIAADKGMTQAVRRLLQAKVDPNAGYGGGKTSLMTAAVHAHTETVKALLQGNANVNAVAKDGHSALIFAAEKHLKDGLVCPIEGASVQKLDSEATVDALLSAAADPNLPGPRQRTALHVACAGGSVNLVERLLSAGASANAMDEGGRTPADVARGAGHAEVAWVLEVTMGDCSRREAPITADGSQDQRELGMEHLLEESRPQDATGVSCLQQPAAAQDLGIASRQPTETQACCMGVLHLLALKQLFGARSPVSSCA